MSTQSTDMEASLESFCKSQVCFLADFHSAMFVPLILAPPHVHSLALLPVESRDAAHLQPASIEQHKDRDLVQHVVSITLSFA